MRPASQHESSPDGVVRSALQSVKQDDDSEGTPAPSGDLKVTLRVTAVTAGGCLLLACAAAIVSIPRGLHEFVYFSKASYWTTLGPLPFAPMNGFTPEQLSSHVARTILLTPACLLIGWGCAPLFRRFRFGPLHGRTIALCSFLLIAASALLVFRGIPVQDDEPTYLMHAEMLARGAIMEPPVPAEGRWGEPFTIFTASGTTGKYLPGTAAILAIGMHVGVPLLGIFVLAAMTVWLVYRMAREESGADVAALGAALLALSPEYVLTSALPLSQTAALALATVALWGVRRGGWGGGLLAGHALGFALICRPQTAVTCGVVIAAYAVRDRRTIVAALASGASWVLLLLLYNSAVTGSAGVLPWTVYSTERYGFGYPFGRVPGMDAYVHTPWKALGQLGVALVRLNGWALGWPISLAGPVGWFALGRPFKRAVQPWAWIALATFVFQLGYYSVGTSDTGAIYHFAALPFFALSTAAVIVYLAATRHQALVVASAAVLMVVGTGSFFVEHVARLRRLTDTIDAPYRTVNVAPPAIVFVETSPAGRPPVGWLVGVAYRYRQEGEPLVYFPAGKDVDLLRKRWQGRRCAYVYVNPATSLETVTSCDEMPALTSRFLEETRQEVAGLKDYHHPESEGPVPRWDRGEWRKAFRWIPWLARCADGSWRRPLCAG